MPTNGLNFRAKNVEMPTFSAPTGMVILVPSPGLQVVHYQDQLKNFKYLNFT